MVCLLSLAKLQKIKENIHYDLFFFLCLRTRTLDRLGAKCSDLQITPRSSDEKLPKTKTQDDTQKLPQYYTYLRQKFKY